MGLTRAVGAARAGRVSRSTRSGVGVCRSTGFGVPVISTWMNGQGAGASPAPAAGVAVVPVCGAGGLGDGRVRSAKPVAAAGAASASRAQLRRSAPAESSKFPFSATASWASPSAVCPAWQSVIPSTRW